MRRATCPECEHTFRLPADFAGKYVACPSCKARVRVDQAADAEDRKEDRRKTAPRAARKDDRDDEPAPRPRRRDRDERDSERQKSGIPGWLIGGVIAGGVLVLVGVGALVWALTGRPATSAGPSVAQPGLPGARPTVPVPPGGAPTVTQVAPGVTTQLPVVTTPGTPTPGTPTPGTPTPPVTTPARPQDKPEPAAPSEAVAAAPVSGEKIYERMLKSAAWILTKTPDGVSHGSGAVIDKNERLLITNHHVVMDATDIAVVFPAWQNGRLITEHQYYVEQIVKNRRFEPGTVVRADPRRDLALVQLERLPDSAVAITPAGRSPLPGQQIWSLGGNPRGSAGQWILGSGTVRQVSFKQYQDDVAVRAAMIIESQVPINSGDSGGPVVDARGQLVGINASTHVRSTLNANHIDVTEVVDFVKTHFRSLGRTWTPPAAVPLDGALAANPAATAKLMTDLRGSDEDARQKAVLALRAQGSQARTVAPELLKVLRDPKTPASLRRELALTLAEIGPPPEQDVSILSEALADAGCLPARVYASDALAKLGAAARPAVKALAGAAASDPAPEVRRTAVAALGKLGPSARPETQATLLKLLSDPDNEVRSGAERALVEAFPPVGTFAKDSPATLDLPAEAVPALTAALGSSTGSVRQFAAYALGTLHEKAGSAGPALAKAAAVEKQAETRLDMYWALREIGPAAAAAAPTLKETVTDITSPRDVVLFAGLALLKVDPKEGPKVALPAIAKALPLPATRVIHPITMEIRRRTAADLKRIGKPAAEALADAVAGSLGGKELEQVAGRLLVLDLIEKMGPEVYSADLAAKLRGISNNRNEDSEVRTAARKTLAAVQR